MKFSSTYFDSVFCALTIFFFLYIMLSSTFFSCALFFCSLFLFFFCSSKEFYYRLLLCAAYMRVYITFYSFSFLASYNNFFCGGTCDIDNSCGETFLLLPFSILFTIHFQCLSLNFIRIDFLPHCKVPFTF